MKKITLLLLLLSSFTVLFAQAPQKMSYQSVIRKADGTLVASALVSIKISIIFDTANGNPSYIETQTATTNNNGLVTIEIGGGTPVTGTFAAINWGAGSHFIKTEIDPTGGSNYTISGTSQLLSVPYALYAGSSQNKGKTSIVITGDITDAQAAAQIRSEFGPYTENVYINGTTNLTTVDLSVVEKLVELSVIDNSNLVSINVANLREVYNDFDVSNNQKLSTLVFPALKKVLGADTGITDNPALVSISFPSLTQASGLFFRENHSLTSINLPSLGSVSGIILLRANALPSSQVNLILSRLLNLTSAKNYIDLSGQNPPAPPTGQGIIDKTALISRNDSVNTD